ncbi:MAG: hypothetical protein H6851_08820 [Geminicoccaceae bacterium]|nr:hypothetical protein [Geminicoccaceae bacterium]MCB9943704.1 hypothetical protein [Geminicoccaceae bacterium]
MRSGRTLLALSLSLAMFSTSVLAADMTGTWKLDKDEFIASARVMMQSQLQDVSEDMRSQMTQMMDGMLDSLASKLSGTAVFNADGTVMVTGEDGKTETGRWEDKGDTVILYTEDSDPVEAKVDGDRMIFSMQDDEMQQPFEMVWKRQ